MQCWVGLGPATYKACALALLALLVILFFCLHRNQASLAPHARWGVIPRPPQIMGLEHVSCQGSLRWPQCGQGCGVDGMAARRSPHHDLHATPTGGAPVHGHALVDDMRHGANNLCGNREHGESLGRLAAPPTSLQTDAVLCHTEDTELVHLKHPSA